MELTLLGTAAAEGWPAPFCDCLTCAEARRRGGANIRSRSGALLDDDVKIDWSADSLSQIQRLNRSISGLRTLIFTHQHSDHIQAEELNWMAKPFTNTPPEHVEIWGNGPVLEILGRWCGAEPKHVSLNLLEPFREVTTASEVTILPLSADHVAEALVLRLTRQGKTIFYGHDSGLYPAETLDALAAGPPLDVALFDCTNGGRRSENRAHMGVDGVTEMVRELRERGCLHAESRLIATHFSHNGGLLHEELVRALLPAGVEVAFDGMVVRVW